MNRLSLEHTDDAVIRSIKETVSSIIPKDAKVILFGSRAKGTALERSDIDIAVCGEEDIEKLREELEDIPTLYTIDVLDMDECGNELLLEDIKQYGRKIYEKI